MDKNFMGGCMVTARSVGIAISYRAARLALLRCLELIDSRQDLKRRRWSGLVCTQSTRDACEMVCTIVEVVRLPNAAPAGLAQKLA